MTMLSYALITLFTFIIMEGVTWLTHKYVMHGFLWYLHEDHHQPGYEGLFEKNDAFFVIFAVPSALLIIYGLQPELNFKFFIGLGIMLYGFAYFMVHEVIIHQRIRWFRNLKHPYFQALRKGHKVHHKHLGKEEGEVFGMLFVPLKYFRQFYDRKSE
jgi:beta-carotene 3-hydroxylase